ncbi:MAG: DUF4468 domain-containing protein, partial [Flavobacteriales bacterium]|nr:DUF4468 domain-containing protein [Flavobacteriales bacterium]
MKKIFLLIIFSFGLSFGQTEFKFGENGVNKFTVTEVPGKTATEIYQKSIEWIKKTYVGPDQVIITTVENDYIRFQGIGKNIYCVNAMGKNCDDIKYTIELNFKDDKFKTEIIQVERHATTSIAPFTKYWSDMTKFYFTKNSDLYNNKGEIRSRFATYSSEFIGYFNSLNSDLKNYVLGTSEKSN